MKRWDLIEYKYLDQNKKDKTDDIFNHTTHWTSGLFLIIVGALLSGDY